MGLVASMSNVCKVSACVIDGGNDGDWVNVTASAAPAMA